MAKGPGLRGTTARGCSGAVHDPFPAGTRNQIGTLFPAVVEGFGGAMGASPGADLSLCCWVGAGPLAQGVTQVERGGPYWMSPVWPTNSINRSALFLVRISSTLCLPTRLCPHSPRLPIRVRKPSTVSPGLARANETATAGTSKLEVGVAEVGWARGIGGVVDAVWDKDAYRAGLPTVNASTSSGSRSSTHGCSAVVPSDSMSVVRKARAATANTTSKISLSVIPSCLRASTSAWATAVGSVATFSANPTIASSAAVRPTW
jgi:hypothetical protein